MFKKVLGFVGVCAIALSMTACARVEPIQNQENQFVPTGLTQSQVGNAIVSAAQSKGWAAREVSPGVIDASINVRKHAAEVRIPYSSKSYAIEYVSSTRLEANGQGTIHRNYNKWVVLLNDKIQTQLRATPPAPVATKAKTATKPKATTKPLAATQSTTVAKPVATTTPVAAAPAATTAPAVSK